MDGCTLNRTIPWGVTVAKVPGAEVLPKDRQHKLEVVTPPRTDPHPLTEGTERRCTWVALFAMAERNTELWRRDRGGETV